MPTLARDLIAETRTLLEGGGRPEMNRLNGAMTNVATTLTLEFPTGTVAKGSFLSIDLELLYVWSVAGQVVTVERAYRGTAAAAHADDAIVYVNPIHTDFAILRALNQELVSYSSPVHGLYRVATVDLTYTPARSGYDLTGVTDVIDVIRVEATGYLPGDLTSIHRWRLARNAVTADFSSGLALELYEPAYAGKTLRVTYSTTFAPLTTVADDVQVVTGLPDTANDIPPLGATVRLVAPREIRRAQMDAQPEPRRAEEVPVSAARNAAGGMLAIRNQRLVEEAARLRNRYPPVARRSA